MAKQAAARVHEVERMAGYKPHKGRKIALEIVTFILFVLFMMPFWVIIVRKLSSWYRSSEAS